MGQIICVMNQKGGVGKTTTAINLGACFARAGFKTLIADLDPQCNATSGLNRKPTDHHPLATGAPWAESVVATDWPKLFILPGSKSYGDAKVLAKGKNEQTERLREMLQTGFRSYDYVLIDSPPAISPLTKTALDCSTEILIPIECEFFAMEGVSKMTSLIEKDRWQSTGILFTMVKSTLELTREVQAEVRDYFGEVVFQTEIPWDVAIPEASSYGKPVIEYAPRSRGARAYIELCMEVFENEQEE
ncbi:MAG: ParA family protein [Thermoguttaceae bacterium]|nr:ParA family protein [Thermoguttaceae bacterium]MDO4857893.1 ParA family protein [Thermoguttaceae bacterium]